MSEQLARMTVVRAEDVFALRQMGRSAAAAVGSDEADQVRLATALSELGREALAHGAEITPVFSLAADGALEVDVHDFPRAGTMTTNAGSGLDAVRRLLEDVTLVDDGDDVVIVHLRRSPHRTGNLNAATIRATLQRTSAPRPLDELRLENRDLVRTLDALTTKQSELVHLNTELEETNRGVLAMYAQLADELEETNRGVVALYAELDERTLQLDAASESKSRFLASVSHELRSPVNSVLGLVRLLLDPASDALTPDQRQQLQFITTSASELLELVNELLDLAKAESGRLDPSPERFDPVDLFIELRGALRPLVKSGVALQIDLRELPEIETDRTLLGQVLRNLLTNALKFTTAGSVRLSAIETDARALEISVADTGIGIDADDQARIFEEFYQVRGAHQVPHKGTGLGLPYARRVTQSLGGEMRVASEIGSGSTFTVVIPLEWQALLRAGESPGYRLPADVKLASVLIIDDDAGFRTALRGMLQENVQQIFEAGGGDEGLRVMRAAPPELVFLDLRMPDRDGTEVFNEMRADPRLRDVPVVIVTSTELSAVTGAAAAGATLMAKSGVTRDAVRNTIASILLQANGAP